MFHGCSGGWFRALCTHITPAILTEHDCLVRQGEPAVALCILLSGRAVLDSAEKSAAGRKGGKQPAVVGPDTIGVFATQRGGYHPFTATVCPWSSTFLATLIRVCKQQAGFFLV